MPARRHRPTRTLLAAVLLALAPTIGTAGQTNVTINATVLEVQCTAEQRLRIRACAPAREEFTMEATKRLIKVRAPGNSAALAQPVRHEIQLDEKRPVLIRTVYY